MTPALPLPLATVALRNAPGVTVARPALGLTLYLDAPDVWARGAVAALFAAFLDLAPVDRLAWFTTSRLAAWQRTGREGLATVARGLPSPWHDGRLRHLLDVRVADDPGAPSVAFVYRELDGARGGGASHMEITLPIEHDPGALAQLALAASAHGPVLSGVGGYVARWNPREAVTGLHVVQPWLRRFHGLDAHDAEAFAWQARAALPGCNWLTVLGASFVREHGLDLVALARGAEAHAIAVVTTPGAALVRAGEQPTLGDLNTLDFPRAYVEVARRLRAWLPDAPPAFPGPRWARDDATRRWMHRFVAPAAWA